MKTQKSLIRAIITPHKPVPKFIKIKLSWLNYAQRAYAQLCSKVLVPFDIKFKIRNKAKPL